MNVGAQEPPWRVIRAFPQANGGSLVHLHNVSGGVLAGDCLTLDVRVDAGAKAQITSTGATRLYRHREGSRCSEQHVFLSVAADGLLEYLPDALIPFGGSRHQQRTSVKLGKGATFFWWEVIAPGRQAMGERFAYESLRVETEIRSGERPLVSENFVLEPGLRALESIARMGEYTHVANFYAMQVGSTPSEMRKLESLLNEMARENSRPGVTIWGASALASDGVVVRGVSTTARELPAMLARYWTTSRRFLTGEEAVPPRKLK